MSSFFVWFLAILTGILSGTVINILVEKINKRNIEKELVKNLIFEVNYNMKKMDTFIEEIDRYKDSVTGDYTHRYFGYFDLSKILYNVAYNMLGTGLLYKYLNHDDVEKLLNFLSEFSSNGQNFINNEIAWVKTSISQEQKPKEDVKQVALQNILFWGNKFKEKKKMLHQIKDILLSQ